MNRILRGIAFGGSIVIGAQALADDPGQSRITKHQMIVRMVDCVKKRVATNNTVSYREAIKTCKDQVKGQTAISPPDPLLALGTEAKR
jgi:hypothetical protein